MPREKHHADAGTKANPSSTSTRSKPKKGEHFQCQQCGMEVQVNQDCGCADPNKVHFECCGQELQRA